MMKRNFLYVTILLFVLTTTSVAQNTDSLQLILKNAKHDTVRCRILDMLSGSVPEEEIIKYNEELTKICDANLKQVDKNKKEYTIYRKYRAKAFISLGTYTYFKGDVQAALDLFNKGVLIQKEIDDKLDLGNSYYSMASIYQNQGELTKAQEYNLMSLKLMEEVNDLNGKSQALSSLGSIFFKLGDVVKALEYHTTALKLKEIIGDKGAIAHSFNELAFIYKKQNNLEKALEFYTKSYELRVQLKKKGDIAQTLNNLGSVHKQLKNYNKAHECFNKSLAMMKEVGNKRGISYVLNNIGALYKTQGDMVNALDYHLQSLKLREEMNDKNGLTFSYINIGEIYLSQKKTAKALENYQKAMVISKEMGTPENIKNAAKALTNVYKLMGNHKLAMENYETYIQMRDSINNLETQKATITQQTQYEYEKKKVIEDEKHAAELRVQEEKAIAEKTRQNVIIASVSVVLLLVAFFSVLLYNRFKTTQKQKIVIEQKEKETQHQKHIIEEKQKEILDSINYAKRIQYTLLAHQDFLRSNLPDHFTFFQPKDIVSGDFYWATKHNNKFYLAVCDSTGHGVPGAFMSLLNIGFLTEAINEKGIEKPNEIFDYVRLKLTNSISKEGQKDGFDGILLCFDQNNKSISYAAANNAPVVVSGNNVIELESDRMPVGVGERKENFKLQTIDLKPGDMIYLYTDGFADQFGGEKGKKFKYKQLNELILANSKESLQDQNMNLKNAFDNWKGKLEQVDDVCIIGIRI